MTLPEKVSQMVHDAAEVRRLGIPAYNWWNECLHGVARAGTATVFPQAIALAATWNTDLMCRVATAISDEARAKHHESVRSGDRRIYKGLTFWSPNINIFRDPRWGRGHETYGECPHLTARMGVAFVKGLQGDHPTYLKLVATPKHYAVHSGPEPLRHEFDARVSKKDLYETYLPAFKACVDAGAWSVMGAYNRTNGEPCCASKTLLQDILRGQWGFPGYVVSDCGAIRDIHRNHRVTEGPAESAALAVKNGCDLNCGEVYEALTVAADQGLITEAEIDVALGRLLEARFRLGMFDPPERVPYAQIPYDVNDCDAHRDLARQAARQSIVLLKNQGALPLDPTALRSIAVIGPNADDLDILLGNYFGTPSRYVTPLEGIRRAAGDAVDVRHARGCDLVGSDTAGFDQAVALARDADVAVMVMGLSPKYEGEEGDVANSDGGSDKVDVRLPGVQEGLLKAVHATGTPVVLVLTSGSAVALNWADEHLPAILQAWYPGEEGGTALAEVLFGDSSPAGRLPVTFVRSVDQLPPFTDCAMKRRTYRYMDADPLYPFGYGLTYTRFQYADLALSADRLPAGQPLEVRANVRNAGHHAADEVVQLYLSDVDASVPVPKRDLRGFRRIHLEPGASETVAFSLSPRDLALINNDGKPVLEPGTFRVAVGGGQPGMRGSEGALVASFEVTGGPLELPY